MPDTAQAEADEESFPRTDALEPLPGDVWQGVCLAHSWENGGRDGYGTPASKEALDHISKLGAEWISVTPFGFMTDLKTTEIRGEHRGGDLPAGAERSSAIKTVAAEARARGIRTVLKPHIWVRGGKWRGHIKPEGGWDAWWRSYEAFIVFWAEVAAEAGIESFVVGVELHTALQADAPRFVQLVQRVREVFDGEVHYAANWNEPVDDLVWQHLDAVGVQFYPPLAESLDAPPSELRETLRETLDYWSAVAVRNDKPLMLTEVGYRSAVSAASHPNAWPERTNGRLAERDDAFQSDLYALFFDELAATPALKGVFIWKYFTNKDTDEEGPAGFSPRGKPAEKVLRAVYGSDPSSESTAAPPQVR